MTKLLIILNCIYFSLLLFCLIASISQWKRIRFKYKVFAFFILLTIIIEVLALIFVDFVAVQKPVYFTYDFINALFISWFWFLSVIGLKLKRFIIFLGTALLLILTIVGIKGKYGEFSNFYTCIANTIFIIQVFIFLLDKILYPTEIFIWKKPDYLYSLSLLLFSSIGIVFWVANNYFSNIKSKSLINTMYYIFLGANYLYYFGIGIAFLREGDN